VKIIHSGDWHIGKLVHGVHMTQDQGYILGKFIDLIEEEKPDILIIAGDIYDRSVPPVEAVELLDSVLTTIVDRLGIKVFAIAGNHDSGDRLGFGGKLLKDKGLYLSGNLTRKIQPISIDDQDGPVDVYMIPYAEPVVVRELFEDPSIKTHQDAMDAIIRNIDLRDDVRNICITHGFFTKARPEEEQDLVDQLQVSDSVRPLSIGGTDLVDVALLEAFDYVALGHLHRPQKVKHDYIRYSGSLLKYSFSEAMQHKSVTIVELSKDGFKDYRQVSLPILRDMRVIEGELDRLLEKEVYEAANQEDYIMARLKDKGELIDPIRSLRSVYPNILKLEKVNQANSKDQESAASGEFTKKGPLALFEEFYEQMVDDDFDQEKNKVIVEIIDKVVRKERNL